MSSSRTVAAVAAAVAVVAAVILMVCAKSVLLGATLGVIVIVCVTLVYMAVFPESSTAGAESERAGEADGIIAAVEEIAEGGEPDVSSLSAKAVDALGRLEGRIALLSDEVSSLTPRDQVTSLAKEDVFNNVLWREFNRAERYGEPLSVALLEAVGIEEIRGASDSAADDALREVASVLLQMIRETDLAARYGDDRFAVVMPGTDSAGAGEFVQRFDRLFEERGGVEGLTVKLGVASMAKDGTKTAPDLVQQAAAALRK